MVIDEEDIDMIDYDYDRGLYSPSGTPTAIMLNWRDMELVDRIKKAMENGEVHWNYTGTATHKIFDERTGAVKETIIDTYTSTIKTLECTVTRCLPNILNNHGDLIDQWDEYYDLSFVENGKKMDIEAHLIWFNLPEFFQQIEQSYSEKYNTV
ncbi:MAG: hypothetical protein Q8R37_02545 [Nanoarchaeota archaeon]|nr:hypothetical protein [Nanoarchaeota archaeon]